MRKTGRAVAVYCSVIIVLLLLIKTGSKAVTTLSENRPVFRQHSIVIDPGHGGEDGGAVSCTGLPESTYNLDISLKLNDLLNMLGYSTKLIRVSDVSVYTKGETLSQKKISDLKERVNMINKTENGLLLSIHQNHYPDSKYSGGQIFYSNTEGSKKLAGQMQAAFISVLNPGSKRQAKQSSGIYLMEHISCPGVLIECGFLSNQAEEAKLRNPDYQKKLSCVIATATCEYLSNT